MEINPKFSQMMIPSSQLDDVENETYLDSILDFHNLDHIHIGGSGSGSSSTSNIPMLSPQTLTCFDNIAPFDKYLYPNSLANNPDYYYENKSFMGNYGVVDNFLGGGGGGYLGNWMYQKMMPLYNINNCQLPDMKSRSFVVSDKISTVNDGYKTKFLDSSSVSSRRSLKCPKKSCHVVKGQWNAEEDSTLIQLVGQHGERKWSLIAKTLPGRIGKQCRERWHNHLRPDIKKDTWSEEEDRVLIKAHSEIGNRWAEIAKRLPGRTENSIKNHWNATKRRQYSKRKCRSKYPRTTLLQDYIKNLNLTNNNTNTKKLPSTTTTNKTNNKRSSKTATVPTSDQVLVPSFDFDEVMSFEDDMFQDGCTIDSLLGMDDTVELDDEGLSEKELDLVEMMSRVRG